MINSPRKNLPCAPILKGKTPGAGRRVKMDRRGNRARNILIRCPATYNGTFDSRAQHPRQCVEKALTGTFPNIGSMRISRVCLALTLGQSATRHHPLPTSAGKSANQNRVTKSDKRRQSICRNLSPLDMKNVSLFAAFCRYTPHLFSAGNLPF